MSSSAAVQQLPCARSHSFLEHESSSISFTTTWRRGKSTKRRSSLLRDCVHPQLHFTQQLFQYTALLPRVHGIKTEATLRVHGNCQREKLWREFFLDPSQWWDHRSEKVSERQTSQSSHVNGAIACVSVSLVALSWLLSCPGLNFAEILFRSFALVG
jgi:hypothetical protein